MHKLVSRTSLETNLKSVLDESSIIESHDENKEEKINSKTENESKEDDDTIVVIY